MTTIEVLPVGQSSLARLVETANREHALVQEAVTDAFEHAISAGEALIAARSQVAPNEWCRWCDDHFTGGLSTGNKYMRIARFRDLLAAEGVTSIRQAKQLLMGLPDSNTRGRARLLSDEAVARIKQLRDDGMSLAAIAELMGVSSTTIGNYLNPELRVRQEAKHRAARDARRKLREAQHEQAIQRAIKRAAKPLAEAYSLAERMQDVLGQAQRAVEDREAKRALSEAGEHYRQMRDLIVRALPMEGAKPRPGGY